MVKKIYDKLVRDNVPAIIEKTGNQTCHCTCCDSDEEYFKYLIKKVEEEIKEFEKNPSPEELADVMEAIETIMHFKNIDVSFMRDYQKLKLIENGSFSSRIILKSVLVYDK